MAGNNYFQFKKFRIIQEKSAMRVGTDGVLLGAWANTSEAERILDVGTGTGLIALMIAQRCVAEITGIEIDKDAAEEATSNVQNSSWPDRIHIIHTSFQDYIKSSAKKFDLIVSNPPFFSEAMRPKTENAYIARHAIKLHLYDLARGADALLNENGKLALILPVASAERFISLAETYKFNLSVLTEVKPSEGKPAHRYLMEFSKMKTPLKKSALSIRNNFDSDYTSEYKDLTHDFYLKF